MSRQNTLLERAAEVLNSRVPAGWTVAARPRAPDHDAALRVTSPGGVTGFLPVVLAPRPGSRLPLTPPALVNPDGALTAIFPWLSRAARDALTVQGYGYVDLTGNVFVVMSEPGLFVRTVGAAHDPSPPEHTTSLRGTKAARLVRLLAMSGAPVGIRELATRAGTTPGYVSKLIALLSGDGIVERTPNGAVERVHLAPLIHAWAEQAPLSSRASATSWLDPRGLSSVLGKLPTTSTRYAVTGSLPAALKAPVASSRSASIYVDDAVHFAGILGLRPADAGANVVLLTPTDDLAYEDTWSEKSVRYAALPQVAADLLTSAGRGPAEAEALLTWMQDHREVWVD